MEEVILMNKSKKIMKIQMEGREIVKLVSILDFDALPIILKGQSDEEKYNISIEKINKWFQKRLIPDKREFYDKVKNYLNEDEINKQHFASLNDQYWIMRQPADKWKNINFFNNKFSEDIGRLFFAPNLVDKNNINYNSPDFSTNGCLRKRWIKNNDGIYLIKAGSKKLKQEPLNEVLASIMLEYLNIVDFVKYDYIIDSMEMCSRCKNFINENEEFVPAEYFYITTKKSSENVTIYEHLLESCEKYEIDAKSQIDSMIAIDFLIGNNDRHLGNFGFVKNVETGKIIRFAPLFDFGNAFWNSTNNVMSHATQARDMFRNEEKRCLTKLKENTSINSKELIEELTEVTNNYLNIPSQQKEKIKDNLNRSIDIYNEKTSFNLER